MFDHNIVTTFISLNWDLIDIRDYADLDSHSAI